MPSKGDIFDRRNQEGHILVGSRHYLGHLGLLGANRQDLNSSVMTGSSRVVSHTTFAELHWRRDPFSQRLHRLPPGFQALAHLLTKEFTEVLEDVHALQCIRDLRRSAEHD